MNMLPGLVIGTSNSCLIWKLIISNSCLIWKLNASKFTPKYSIFTPSPFYFHFSPKLHKNYIYLNYGYENGLFLKTTGIETLVYVIT